MIKFKPLQKLNHKQNPKLIFQILPNLTHLYQNTLQERPNNKFSKQCGFIFLNLLMYSSECPTSVFQNIIGIIMYYSSEPMIIISQIPLFLQSGNNNHFANTNICSCHFQALILYLQVYLLVHFIQIPIKNNFEKEFQQGTRLHIQVPKYCHSRKSIYPVQECNQD